jgi:hypothetical protein
MDISTTSALINSQISLSNWIQISLTLLLAATAFLAPYLIERWKFTYRSPKLKIKFKLAPPGCHLTQMVGVGIDFPVYYFRFLVENIGKTQAEECEVFLEKIYKENSSGEMIKFKNFSPVNLKWSGIREPFKRIIQPGKEMFCDIGKVQHPDHNYESKYRSISARDQRVNKFIFELPEIYYSQWDCLIPGKYRITVSVYSKNAEKVSRNFNISWTGRWENEESNMFNELVIH